MPRFGRRVFWAEKEVVRDDVTQEETSARYPIPNLKNST